MIKQEILKKIPKEYLEYYSNGELDKYSTFKSLAKSNGQDICVKEYKNKYCITEINCYECWKGYLTSVI